MNIAVTDELLGLFREIVKEQKTAEEWAEIESDDMFQSESFCGGYDATEEAFTFSYYDPSSSEYWFQLTLPEVESIVAGSDVPIEARPAE
jgi:hypothetical protein